MDQPPKPEKPVTPAPPKKKLSKLKEGLNKLPEKKAHLDFIAGILTIPLLIITLIFNINNLTGKNASAKTSPTPSAAPSIIYKNGSSGNAPLIITAKPQGIVSQEQCVKDIGPISISYPQEGQTVSDNPLCIGIDYQAGNYCSVVWAYQINGNNISGYSNNSVCLYNLPSGQNTFILHSKSLVSSSTKTLTRTFNYKNSAVSLTPTLTSIPTGTPAPSVSVTPTP